MRRIALAAAVALIVILLTAPGAGAGTGNPFLLRLLAVTEREAFVDVGPAGESAGDRFIFRDGLYRWENGRQGAKVGRIHVSCELIGQGGGVINCLATAFVPGGTIVLGGFIRADGDFSVPVLGGTGSYRGVGGVARVRDLAADRTSYVFRLTR
jgi:hypothetical protein